MAIDFPDSPSVNDTFAVGGRTYTWNGTQWKRVDAEVASVSPSLTVTGDFTADTDTLVVDSTNNRVGIGTTSPAKKLHVKGDNEGIRIEDGGATDHYDIYRNDTTGHLEFTGSQTSFSGYDFEVNNGTNVMRISNAGNVGIGTTSPAGMLHVSGSNPTIWLTDTDTNADSYVSGSSSVGSLILSADENNEVGSSQMSFKVDGTERITVLSNGNVGINDTTPSHGLDVNGAVNTTSKYLRGGKATGDTLLASGSFGTSGTAITSVFSGDYANYRILLRFKNSIGSEMYYRMMNGGAWYTSTVYETQRLYAQGTSVGATRVQAQSYGRVGYTAAGHWSAAEMTIYNPYSSSRETDVASHEVYGDNVYAGMIEIDHSQVQTATSFDGIFIGNGAGGTLYGSYYVYGIAQ